jgi:uncharacterized alkaline shock family protein YloU
MQEQIEPQGTLIIKDEVVAIIAGTAAREVEGVYALGAGGASSVRRTLAERLGGAPEKARGVNVEVGLKEATVNLELRVIYGYSIPKVATKVRQNVADKILNLCGLATKEVNINIVDIYFPEGGEEAVTEAEVIP